MGKFIVEPHFRLQEWVAEEKGYFGAEGLDYEFRELIRSTAGQLLGDAGEILDERADVAVVLREGGGQLGELGHGVEERPAALAEGLGGLREVVDHLVAEGALAVDGLRRRLEQVVEGAELVEFEDG